MELSEWLRDDLAMEMPSPDILACARTLVERRLRPPHDQALACPRCESVHTKFCYYNNYSLSQPRYFCKTCRRYWTKGGTLRNIPVGGGCRKNKKVTTKKLNDQLSTKDRYPPSSATSPLALPQDTVDLQFPFPPLHLKNTLVVQEALNSETPIEAGDLNWVADVQNSRNDYVYSRNGEINWAEENICRNLGLIAPKYQGMCFPTGSLNDNSHMNFYNPAINENESFNKLLPIAWQDQLCYSVGGNQTIDDLTKLGQSWTGKFNGYGMPAANTMI